jgi:peptidoglycan-associated lipoprotein
MKKMILYFIAIMFSVSFLSSCTSTGVDNTKSPSYSGANAQYVSAPTVSQSSENGMQYPSVGSMENGTLTPEEVQRKILQVKKDIHFKFNSSRIEPINEYGIDENPDSILDDIASIMNSDQSIKLRIEGNCDERGTEEYNLALGQRRAISAKRYLTERYNIDPNRIDTLSYGESQPVDMEHNQAAWAQNRRDHFVFVK